MATTECFDCGRTVMGCKKVNWVCDDYMHGDKMVSFKTFLGSYVCRACLNAERRGSHLMIHYNVVKEDGDE